MTVVAAKVPGLRIVQLEELLGYLQHRAGDFTLVLPGRVDDLGRLEGEGSRVAGGGQ
jgi:hypothetical protein